MLIALGIMLCLIGGAMIETPIVGYLQGEAGLVQIIFGVLFGALFLAPGVVFIHSGVKDMIKKRWELPLKDVLEALKPGFREASSENSMGHRLANFREHYSEFFGKAETVENEKIQRDVTQIFRTILQLQKERLNRFGLTCELLIKRMAYTKGDGIKTESYSDGRYGITDVTEEVAARTVYKKDGREVYTKVDKEIANYTVVRAKTVGENVVVCPNCGVETTREALLDGCDYCGTKFTVEDLGSRIAVFAFRPDVKLRYEKYARTRNKVMTIAALAAILAVFLMFIGYAVIMAPDLYAKADGGIILTLLASVFAVIIASPIYIISFLIVYAYVIIPVGILLIGISIVVAKMVMARRDRPMLARGAEEAIRKVDPNFSAANFYSGLQNKLSSVIYAENREQIRTFAQGDLTGLLGRFSDVVGVDVDHMEITRFSLGEKLQCAEVDVFLFLTRYNGKRCRVKRETMHVTLLKDAACKTQVVCAPAVMRCRSCGAPMDLLRGKRCGYCGETLDLIRYDWVIGEIRIL